MKLVLNTCSRGDVAIVECRGDILCDGSAEAFLDRVRKAVENGGPVLIDISRVRRIDCGALGALARSAALARANGVALSLVGASRMARLLLTLTRLHTVLRVEDAGVECDAVTFAA